jgi:hypothetical protein
MKRYKVTLEPEERQHLHDLIAAGQAAVRKLAHARILLKADAADVGPAWPDHRIADALEVSTATVERVRQRFVELGLDAALDRTERHPPGRGQEVPGRGRRGRGRRVNQLTPTSRTRPGDARSSASAILPPYVKRCLSALASCRSTIHRGAIAENGTARKHEDDGSGYCLVN